MKNWCYANIENWYEYQLELQLYANEVTRDMDPDDVYFYVQQDKFFTACPELRNLIETYYGKINRTTLFVVNSDQVMRKIGNNYIHIDGDKPHARLNWPVLNPESIVTRFFKAEDGYLGEKKRFREDAPSTIYSINYDASRCTQVDEVCINQPVIFNVKQPHGLFRAPGPLPRIMISFNFYDDSPLRSLLGINS